MRDPVRGNDERERESTILHSPLHATLSVMWSTSLTEGEEARMGRKKKLGEGEKINHQGNERSSIHPRTDFSTTMVFDPG
jgi:hypothetical protein